MKVVKTLTLSKTPPSLLTICMSSPEGPGYAFAKAPYAELRILLVIVGNVYRGGGLLYIA